MVLKEKIKCFEMVIMLLSLVSVIVFSIFTDGNDEGTKAKSSLPMWALYAALGATPVLVAAGTVAMRKMKKFHEAVVSWYLNLAILIASLIMVLVL